MAIKSCERALEDLPVLPSGVKPRPIPAGVTEVLRAARRRDASRSGLPALGDYVSVGAVEQANALPRRMRRR